MGNSNCGLCTAVLLDEAKLLAAQRSRSDLSRVHLLIPGFGGIFYFSPPLT